MTRTSERVGGKDAIDTAFNQSVPIAEGVSAAAVWFVTRNRLMWRAGLRGVDAQHRRDTELSRGGRAFQPRVDGDQPRRFRSLCCCPVVLNVYERK